MTSSTPCEPTLQLAPMTATPTSLACPRGGGPPRAPPRLARPQGRERPADRPDGPGDPDPTAEGLPCRARGRRARHIGRAHPIFQPVETQFEAIGPEGVSIDEFLAGGKGIF